MAQTIPFKETLHSKEELFEDFKEFAKRKQELGQNALLAYYGLLHGAAITQYCDKQNKQQDLLRHAGIPVTSLAYFQAGINAWNNLYKGLTVLPELNEKIWRLALDSDYPLQQIFYGAPGTGKSYEVNEKTKGYSVIRTTFHPDTDYASFVGTYKPTMEKGKITYQFVKQAFLKAYLAAWKKMCRQPATPITKPIPLDNVYVITSIDDKLLWHSKTEKAYKKRVSSIWIKLWNSGFFQIPKGRQSGATLEQAISNWIYSNYPNCKREDFDKGWDLLIKVIKDKNVIETSTNKRGNKSKKFKLSPGENDDTVIYFTEGNKKDKERIGLCYNKTAKPIGVETKIIKKLQDYHTPTFDEAWDKLEKEFNDINPSAPESEDVAPDRQFLIIEEINRGNCAQIFGDLFQLLDRSDNGFSTYPIEADADMQKAIEAAFKSEPEYQLGGDINVEGMVSNYGPTLSKDIQEGRILVLPSNLYIWATMNTSDQSLFPMDSAFKRRWEWKCVPIDYDNPVSGRFTITIDGTSYRWHNFLKEVNERIKTTTQSEDKQMGNFFIKENIDERQFINKVMFYLWNDICKDEYLTKNNFFRTYSSKTETEEFTFNDLFGQKAKELLKKFMEYLQVKPINETPATVVEIVAETEAQ